MAEFLGVLLFILAGFAFVGVSLLISGLVRPSKSSAEKAMPYECGENPVGPAWVQFNIRFYVFALAFIIFDVEAVFLFTWAISIRDLGGLAIIDMLIFLTVLLLGWGYALRKGALKWQ